MTKKDFYKQLKKIGFEQIVDCEGRNTDYFFVLHPSIKIVVSATFRVKREYGLYVRDIKDDNYLNNLLLCRFFPDDKSVKFIKQFVEFANADVEIILKR